MRSVTVRAPAKVNLHLAVGGTRADGFHELTTVFQAVSLYDEVTVAALDPADADADTDTDTDTDTITITGEGADAVPADAGNLALRAVHALAAATGTREPVHVSIRKGIPVAGGMAGGSADAAAALLAADALWGTGLDRPALAALAAGLGSDVPFALHGGTAVGTGRGERLSPVLGRGQYHWVLALADEGLSTPAVYAKLDELRTGPRPPAAAAPADGVLAALRAGDAVALGRALANDLQAPALTLRPRLRRLLDAGRDLGAIGGLVSGSGPTVAFLVRDAADGVRLAASLAGENLCRGLRQAVGPVPGARVLTAAEAVGGPAG